MWMRHGSPQIWKGVLQVRSDRFPFTWRNTQPFRCKKAMPCQAPVLNGPAGSGAGSQETCTYVYLFLCCLQYNIYGMASVSSPSVDLVQAKTHQPTHNQTQDGGTAKCLTRSRNCTVTQSCWENLEWQCTVASSSRHAATRLPGFETHLPMTNG